MDGGDSKLVQTLLERLSSKVGASIVFITFFDMDSHTDIFLSHSCQIGLEMSWRMSVKMRSSFYQEAHSLSCQRLR